MIPRTPLSLLFATAVSKGARHRQIQFPPGRWTGDDGSVVVGPQSIDIPVPLHRLPYYRLER